MQLFGLSEPVIRLIAFAAIFLSMAAFELLSPRLERPEMMGALKARRWFTNLSVLILSSLLLRVIFPLAAVGTALWAAERGYGLFHVYAVPPCGSNTCSATRSRSCGASTACTTPTSAST